MGRVALREAGRVKDRASEQGGAHPSTSEGEVKASARSRKTVLEDGDGV